MGTTQELTSQIGGFMPSLGGGSVSSIMPYVFAFILLGVGVYFFGRHMKFGRYMDTPIINLSERAGRVKILMEKGGYVPDRKKRNVWNFWIKQDRKPSPNPPYESLYPSSKGNIAVFYEKSPTERFPAILDFEQPVEYIDVPMTDKEGNEIKDDKGNVITQKVAQIKVKVIEHDIQLWQQNMDGILDNEFQARNDLKQVIPMILWGVFVFGTVIGLYILAKQFGVLGDVASNLAETARVIKQSGVAIPSNAPG